MACKLVGDGVVKSKCPGIDFMKVGNYDSGASLFVLLRTQNLPERHLSILCGRIQFLEALKADLADSAKTCSGRPRKRRPTEMEFDHELHL